MSIEIAVRPKYPTRRAVEKVLYNNDNFVDIVNIDSPVQISNLTGTSFVAIVYEGSYYPITDENVVEQFELVKAGEAPTVEADDNFGVKKLEYFLSVAEDNEILSQIQENIEVYNGIIRGRLFKVAKFEDLGDEKITENGYWVIFNVDVAGAAEAGYTELKFMNDEEVADGVNYVFLGKDEEAASKAIIRIAGKYTPVNAEEDVEGEDINLTLDTKLALGRMVVANSTSDEYVPAVTVNGKEYATFEEAFAAALANNGTIDLNKSVVLEGSPLTIENGEEVTINLANTSIGFSKAKSGFVVSDGKLNLNGEGRIYEVNHNYSTMKFGNQSTEKSAELNINGFITIEGTYGILVSSKVVNTTINCKGANIVGENYNGTGVYVNGTAKDSVNINLTECNISGGIFNSGNANVTCTKCDITGGEYGIEVRAGHVVINDCNVKCLYEEEPHMTPSGNGSATYGGAIGIAQHTNKNDIYVEINKGKFEGPIALFEGNPQNNPTATEQTTIVVNEGSFIGTYEGKDAILTVDPANDCTGFLYGGGYNKKPAADYVAEGYVAAAKNQRSYEVRKANIDDLFLQSLNVTPIEDFMYKVNYPVTEFEETEKWVESRKDIVAGGACSGIHCGNLRGRNYDWFYSNDASFLIPTPAKDGHKQVIGGACCIAGFTKDVVDSKEYNEIYRHLGWFVIDGMNEDGLCIQSNVVPEYDFAPTMHSKKGYKKICNLLSVKYMLDNASNVDEALAILKNNDIWVYENDKGQKVILHWLISDATGKCVVAEFVDGELRTIDAHIMTNCYQTIEEEQLHPAGLERYASLENAESGITSMETMLDAMKGVWYTKAYDKSVDPFWYSEYNMVHGDIDLNIHSTPEEYEPVVNASIEQYENRDRSNPITWETVYTTIFDVENKIVWVVAGEGENVHKYDMNGDELVEESAPEEPVVEAPQTLGGEV